RRLFQIARFGDTVNAGRAEDVDSVDRAAAAVDGDAVFAFELGGVIAIADLGDARIEQVGRGAPVGVQVEDAVGQKVGEVADVELFEKGRIARDHAREELELRDMAPGKAEITRGAELDLRIRIVAPEG